jgi:peptide deformylase
MAVRGIVLYAENEAALRQKSEPVRAINRRVKNLIRDLKDTLAHHADGAGLAAPQINAHGRVIVVQLGERSEAQTQPGPPVVLINPEILEAGREERDFDGCLSFPGLYAETIRPHWLHIAGLDEWGKPFNRIFDGFDAVVVHHEIDHLNGVLFVDRVEDVEDLYQVQLDEKGRWVRVPVPAIGT